MILFFMQPGEDFDYRCQQASQLQLEDAPLAAPWVDVLGFDAWLRCIVRQPLSPRLLTGLVCIVPASARRSQKPTVMVPTLLKTDVRSYARAAWRLHLHQ